MKHGLKTAALAFGVSFLLGSVALVHADSVDNSSESHRSETTTNAAGARGGHGSARPGSCRAGPGSSCRACNQ